MWPPGRPENKVATVTMELLTRLVVVALLEGVKVVEELCFGYFESLSVVGYGIGQQETIWVNKRFSGYFRERDKVVLFIANGWRMQNGPNVNGTQWSLR